MISLVDAQHPEFKGTVLRRRSHKGPSVRLSSGIVRLEVIFVVQSTIVVRQQFVILSRFYNAYAAFRVRL